LSRLFGQRFNVWSALLSFFSIALLFYGLGQGHELGWQSIPILSSLGLAWLFGKHSPPLFEKGGPGGVRTSGRAKIPPNPPLPKEGTERLQFQIKTLLRQRHDSPVLSPDSSPKTHLVR
jgi:hypothetical protein